jgi:hypothetical protein
MARRNRRAFASRVERGAARRAARGDDRRARRFERREIFSTNSRDFASPDALRGVDSTRRARVRARNARVDARAMVVRRDLATR